MGERTPEQNAIQNGIYLAKAARRLLETLAEGGYTPEQFADDTANVSERITDFTRRARLAGFDL